MKKVVILLTILLFGIILNKGVHAQVAYADIEDAINNRVSFKSYDVSEIADDSVYYFRISGKEPVTVSVAFTYLSADDATLDIFKGIHVGDSIYYMSIDGLISTDLPLTLVKATYSKSIESDTMSSFTVIQDYWTEDLICIKLDPSNGTTGSFEVIIDR